MAVRDEFQNQEVEGLRPWKDRSPAEHGKALAELMLFVSALPHDHWKTEPLRFPVLKLDTMHLSSDAADNV